MQAGPSSEGRSTRPRKPKGAYADDEATAQAFLAEQDAAAVEPKTAAKAVRKSTKSGGSASKDAERANPAAKVHVCAGVRFMELVRLLPELMTIFDGLDDARFTTALKVPLTSPRGSPKASVAAADTPPALRMLPLTRLPDCHTGLLPSGRRARTWITRWLLMMARSLSSARARRRTR